MAYSTNTQGMAPPTNTTPATGYPNGPGLMNPSSSLPLYGPYGGSRSIPLPGQSLGGGNQTSYTNIGGYNYAPGSPEAVAAARANQITGAGSAGTAAGTYTQSALNSIPSLQGLYSGIGSAIGGAGTTGGAGAPGTGTGTSGGVVGTGTGATTGGGAGGAYVAPIQVPDQSAANAAQFAAAKDTVGQNARAALDSLRGEMGATGQLGGGAEATGTQNVITAGEGQLGNVTRQQAATNAQLGTQVAEQNAQLGVTQRGQDVQAQQAQAQLALENRQQLFGLLGLAMKGLGGGGATGGSLSAPSLQLY